MKNKFSINDLMQFGLFILELLTCLWRNGSLAGGSPDKAFFRSIRLCHIYMVNLETRLKLSERRRAAFIEVNMSERRESMALFEKFKKNKTLTPGERRAKTLEQLEKQGIAYNPHLPLLPSGEQINLKSPEEVKKRALACMLSIQLACSIRNGEDYSQSLSFVLGYVNDWKLSIDDFLPKERTLIQNKYTQNNSTVEISSQNVIDVAWTYEVYWALIWALDLISDKELVNATEICNTERAMAISMLLVTVTARLRNVERILDKLDLFYCYHWACVEQSLRPETKIGKLNHEVVMERRKGLEWLISEKEDWDEIPLST